MNEENTFSKTSASQGSANYTPFSAQRPRDDKGLDDIRLHLAEECGYTPVVSHRLLVREVLKGRAVGASRRSSLNHVVEVFLSLNAFGVVQSLCRPCHGAIERSSSFIRLQGIRASKTVKSVERWLEHTCERIGNVIHQRGRTRNNMYQLRRRCPLDGNAGRMRCTIGKRS